MKERVIKSMVRSLAVSVCIISAIRCGSQPAKAGEKPSITCDYVLGWNFKRCENQEVICYTNDVGLSCWKKEQ